MKRLLGLLGITCLCVLTACFYLGDTVAFVLCILGYIMFVISMFIKPLRQEGTFAVAGLVVALSAFMFLLTVYSFVYPVQEKYDGETVEIKAVQQGEMYHSYNNYCYKLKVKSIDGEPINTRLMLYSSDAIISQPYNDFVFTAQLYKTSSGKLLSERVYLTSYVETSENVTVNENNKKPLMYYVCELRSSLRRALYLEMDSDTADFSSALLLGDKYAMNGDAKQLLRTCGISHIAVVSGLHLSIIAFVCKAFMMFVTKGRKNLSLSVTIVVALLFALLTGLGRSVIRATVLLAICFVGKMIKRQSDSVNSIGAAALLLCTINPLAVGDIGMLLSFAATLGIVMWPQGFIDSIMGALSKIALMKRKAVSYVVKTIVNCVCVTVCALLWTLPISVLAYGKVSLVAVVANLLTVPVLFVVIILVALCAVLHYIPFVSLICNILSYIVELYYDYLIFVCEKLSKLRFSYVCADRPFFYVFMAGALLIIAVAVIVNKNKFSIISFALVIVLFCTSYVVYFVKQSDKLTLYIPDTGSGLSVVLESSDGHAVLCAGGSTLMSSDVVDVISDFPDTNSDLMMIMPGDNSKKYIRDVTNEFDYKNILRYDKEVGNPRTVVENDVCITEFSGKYSVDLWDKATVKLIPADNKVFQYVIVGDTQMLIIPQQADCEALPDEYRTPDVIITRDVFENSDLVKCSTLIVAGSDYKTYATAEICSSVADELIFGGTVAYDIKLSR